MRGGEREKEGEGRRYLRKLKTMNYRWHTKEGRNEGRGEGEGGRGEKVLKEIEKGRETGERGREIIVGMRRKERRGREGEKGRGRGKRKVPTGNLHYTGKFIMKPSVTSTQ